MAKSKLRIGVVLNYVNMGLGNLIPLFYTPIMLALLGQDEYGLYRLSSSITGYLGLLSMGLGTAVTHYLIKARIKGGGEAESRMLGLFVLLFRSIAVLTLVVGIVLAHNVDRWYATSLSTEELSRMKVLSVIMVVNMALSFSVAPYLSIVTAREEYVFYQLMNIMTTCVAPGVNLVALYMGYASIGLAVSSLAVALSVRIIYMLYVRYSLHIRASYKHLPTQSLREIFNFSFWVFIGNIVDQLYNATDTLMIGARPELAIKGVAVYSIGTVFSGMALSITAGISSLLMPRTARMVHEGVSARDLTDFAVRVGRLQTYLITTILTVFFLFGKPFIHFYLGNGYEEAYWIALVVMAPLVIPLAQSACLSILVAKSMHKYRAIMLLLIAVMNVFGTWLALPYMGILGAAVVTGISLIIGNGLVMNWFYKTKTDLDLGYFWTKISKCYAVPILLCLATILIINNVDLYRLFNLVVAVTLFLLFLFLGQYRFAFNEYEKEIFMSPLRKLFHKK